MEPYKNLYFLLFNKLTDLIEEMQAVQLEAEKLFAACTPKSAGQQETANAE